MNYLSFIIEKLKIKNNDEILDKATKYIGVDYPSRIPNLKGFEIVDLWFKKIMETWNIEFNILDLSQSSFLGKLEPKQNGFILNLNKNLFTTKKRFTIAHEIAHILSFDTSSRWPERKVIHSKQEEDLCNQIARSMLLPNSLFNFNDFNLNDIDETQIVAINNLWKEYQVAPWQVIQKLYDFSVSDSLICIFWQHYPEESILRIKDHCKPKNVYIPKNDRVFLSDLLKKRKTNFAPAIAFNLNKLYKGYDLVEIGTFYKRNLFTMAFPIKTSFGNYVFQIIKL